MSNVNHHLKSIRSVLLGLFISACSAGVQQTSSQENDLLGNWCARSKPAFYEEFVLEIEDGKHSFRSYLHQRPDEFGTWVLGKNQLIVMGDSGRKTEYKIEEFSSQAIVLIRNSGDKEYYYRDGCVAVEVPTD